MRETAQYLPPTLKIKLSSRDDPTTTPPWAAGFKKGRMHPGRELSQAPSPTRQHLQGQKAPFPAPEAFLL